MNLEVEKLFGELIRARRPYLAAVGCSAQYLRADGIATAGNGEDAFEAVWRAFGAALLAGRVTKENWVAVVCRLDQDGHLVEPDRMDQEVINILARDGLNAVFYVTSHGDMEVETPTTN